MTSSPVTSSAIGFHRCEVGQERAQVYKSVVECVYPRPSLHLKGALSRYDVHFSEECWLNVDVSSVEQM
jgi:hypothetical protein